MPKQNAALYAFNAGEVSKNALARVDVAKMRLAAQCQVNWMPWVVGAAMLRPGLQYVGETLIDQKTKLLPFVFSKTDTALLELTPNNMRVWINEQLLARGAVGTTVTNPTFQTGGGGWSTANTTAGCTATVAAGIATLTASAIGGLAQIQQTLTIAAGDQGKEHGLRIVVSNGPVTIRVGSAAGLSDYLSQTVIDTGTHSLAFTPTSGSAVIQIESTDLWAKSVTNVSIEAAGAVQIATTWAASDLPNLRWDQSGDIIFVACYGQQQRTVERRGTRPGARGWSFVLYRSSDGPFHELADAPTLTMTPSTTNGNGSITASGPFFNSGHVGALLRLFTPGFNAAFAVDASGFYTPPVKVTGIAGDRNLTVIVSGTFSGTWTMQRSLLGVDQGFVDVPATDGGWLNSTGSARITPSFTTTFNQSTGFYYDNDSGSSTTTPYFYNNVSAWYRLGFNAGQLASGAPTMELACSNSGSFGIARITSIQSSTVANVEIVTPFSSLNPTAAGGWQISDWCSAFGWPTSVAFHENRLWWFSNGQIPVSGSDSNNYTSFAEEDRYGNSLGDSGAIIEGFGQGPMDTVSWGLSLTRLLMGREQSIASARSSNFDQAMTPTNFVLRDCSDQGAARLPAIKVGKRGIYVQQTTRRVYELFFNPSEFDYDERDLTRLNIDIGVPGFLTAAKVDQPDKTIWLPRGDGQCAALLYDVKDEIEAWWRLQTLGVIEDACVLPGDGRGAAGEQLEGLSYFIVKRTINGVTRRFIERLARRDQCVGGALNYQLDCAVSYSGAATSSITVAQLPNTLVSVWADGAFIGTGTTNNVGVLSPLPDGKSHSNIIAGVAGTVIIGSVNNPLSNNVAPNQIFAQAQGTLTVGTQYNGYPAEVFADIGGTGKAPQHIGSLVVSGGTITLPNSQIASTIVAFLGYVAPFQSAKLAYAAQLGSALTMKKKADHVGLVLYDAAATALQQGQRMDLLDAMPLMEADQQTPAGTTWSEYDGPMTELPGEWDTDARLCLLAQAPNPCTIGAAVIAVGTNEKT